MRTHRTVWRTAVGITAVLGAAGTVPAGAVQDALVLGVLLAVFGGALGHVWAPELPEVGHPVLLGAALFAAPAVYPGLLHLLGPFAPLVVVVLVAGSPWLVTRALRWMRGRLLPTRAETAVRASPEEALRLQWETSSRQLAEVASLREEMLLVRLREQILDEILERSGGTPPAYLWSGTSGRGGSETSAHGS